MRVSSGSCLVTGGLSRISFFAFAMGLMIAWNCASWVFRSSSQKDRDAFRFSRATSHFKARDFCVYAARASIVLRSLAHGAVEGGETDGRARTDARSVRTFRALSAHQILPWPAKPSNFEQDSSTSRTNLCDQRLDRWLESFSLFLERSSSVFLRIPGSLVQRRLGRQALIWSRWVCVETYARTNVARVFDVFSCCSRRRVSKYCLTEDEVVSPSRHRYGSWQFWAQGYGRYCSLVYSDDQSWTYID